jgi:predicted acyltransferase
LNQRFYSLDVFRGATVALMILVNNPGSWSHIYSPLEHASWHGITPTDLVFPFFLFAVGNAIAFVMPRFEEAGTAVFLRKIIKRSLLIFGIGLFLNWSPFIKWSDNGLVFKNWVDPSNPENGIRILGVLQRIAISYFFASLIIYFFKIRGAFVISIILLLGYWMLCLFLGNSGDPFSMAGYFGTPIDKAVLGIPHTYKGEGVAFDPEGIMSTLPSIVQVIFGYLAGNYIREKGKTYEMLTQLFVAGCLLLFAGYCWNLVFPINKKIWSSSFVVYTSGMAMVVLGIAIHAIEMKGKKGWLTKFFEVFGKNPLFIFVLSGFLPRVISLFRWVDHLDGEGKPVYTSFFPWIYDHFFKRLPGSADNGSLLYAILIVLFYWSIGYWLDRKKIYIRV